MIDSSPPMMDNLNVEYVSIDFCQSTDRNGYRFSRLLPGVITHRISTVEVDRRSPQRRNAISILDGVTHTFRLADVVDWRYRMNLARQTDDSHYLHSWPFPIPCGVGSPDAFSD